ncbi:tumor necrosis factor receptor superfamily member 14-like isoform X2 [Boleophthalmus pectinirostris]|uniref:tumor necrosis factor receptor superfamily member 14-like isoform X2 n=1 Tax=Boleophthalmus pectinirostris TaxID=150288 RepID=UPI00242D652C|nr:tumor necrosis factor receptor superfamily member 14-like isoform X2 [Boleophthalmus pectinirostris]
MKNQEEVTTFLLILIIFVVEVTSGLTCHPSEYPIGVECCPMCPVGTRVNKHCTEFRSTSCLPCDGGTYMNKPTGRTECLRCRMCAAGSGLRVKVSCTSTSNTLCEPEDRFFCVEPSDEGNCEASQKHSLCSPGEFIQQPGSSSTDTVCSPCPPDSFSNGTLSVCRPHTRQMFQ